MMARIKKYEFTKYSSVGDHEGTNYFASPSDCKIAILHGNTESWMSERKWWNDGEWVFGEDPDKGTDQGILIGKVSICTSF